MKSAQRFLPAVLLAAGLLALPAPALPEEADFVAWGTIPRLMAGDLRAVIKPERGEFVAGRAVELYEGNRFICETVVQNVYPEGVYIFLGDACRRTKRDLAKVLAVQGAGYHQIRRHFIEREGAVITGEMKEKIRSSPVDVKTLSVRLEGKEGLSVSAVLIDSSGRPAASDGNAVVRIALLERNGEDDAERTAYRTEFAVARSDFRRGGAGAGNDEDSPPTWWTGLIPFTAFDIPPPRKAGVRGRIYLGFRAPDGSLAFGFANFSFDGAN